MLQRLAILIIMPLAMPAAESEPDATRLVQLTPFVVESSVIPDRAADDFIHPVEIVTIEELRRRLAGTLGETLGSQLGVANSSFGPGVGRPVIRGQGGPRVQVLENGIRTMDLSVIAADHALTTNPLHARKIEVLKGPSALIYGSGATAGVVNVLNNRMPRHFQTGLSGNLGYAWSDNAGEDLGAIDVTHGWESFAVQADFALQRAGDHAIPGYQDIGGTGRPGVLENSSIRNYSGAVSTAWVGERGYLGLAVSRVDNDYGIPEVIDPGDPEFERIHLDQTRFDLRAEIADPLAGVLSLGRLAFGYNDYRQQEVEFEAGEEEVHVEFANKEYDLRADFVHLPLGPLAGVVGMHLTHRDFAAAGADGDDFFIPPSRTRSLAIFVVEEWPFAWGRIDLGSRLERNRANPVNGAARGFGLHAMSAGALWDIDPLHHVKVGYNRAERAPAPEELFSAGRHAATRNYEVGDAGLGAEQTDVLDLSLDRHGDRWSWRVNVFYKRIDAYIFPEYQVDGAGAVIMVDDDGGSAGELRNRLVHFRQHDAVFHGCEAETRLTVLRAGADNLVWRLFGDLARGRLRGSREHLPQMTPARVGTALEGAWGPLDGFIELARSRGQERIGRGETRTAGYTLLGFDVGYTLRRDHIRTRLFVRGRNLLDEEVRLHTSYLKDAAPQPGRAIGAGIQVDF
jgi:iron complex outermembrane receptor protein